MKRQMEAILLFVDFALQKCSRKTSASHEAVIQETVRLLLELTDLDQESITSAEFSDVSRAAMKALGHLLRVISASEFAASISTILASNNPTVSTTLKKMYIKHALPSFLDRKGRDEFACFATHEHHACDPSRYIPHHHWHSRIYSQ